MSWFASWFDNPTEECQQLQRHPLMGAKIIADGDSALLQSANTTALDYLLSGQLALILAIKQRGGARINMDLASTHHQVVTTRCLALALSATGTTAEFAGLVSGRWVFAQCHLGSSASAADDSTKRY